MAVARTWLGTGRGKAAAWTAALALSLAGGAVRAEVDLIAPDTFSGLLDLRLGASNGESSWVDGGFGKTRIGGGADARAFATGELIWTPRLSWDLEGVVELQAQPHQEHPIDLDEAYLRYKPVPHNDWRVSGRLGLFYPPISLEHDAPGWTLTRTITPSAINSWVGEEVKVLGAEASVSRQVGGGELGLTGALFGYNDTAGTLLTYRGWALDDVHETAFNAYDLPPLSQFAASVQPEETYPTREIDGRVGYYLRADWRSSGPLALNALYYDNNGDKVSVTNSGQWSWATRFVNLGMSLDIDRRTQVLSQVMAGRTQMGFPTPGGLWFDVDFDAAYLLVSRDIGFGALTGRADWFKTHDRSLISIDNNDEHGWALTAAWRYDLSKHARLMLEALHVDSDRPSRFYAGISALQRQTTVQSSLKLSF